MTADRWSRLKEIFQGALDQPAESRTAWLRNACGPDHTLLWEAQGLLDAHDTAGQFLEQPARIDPAELDTLPEGTLVGTYRIVRELGRGGMGVVYLATDERLGRTVALKALPIELSANRDLRERLRREARAAATISHPAVATIYALEEHDGHLVIASEYVPGDTLRVVLESGAVEPSRAHRIAVQIADALTAAHEAGVVHRDLKPENVIVAANDRVKVVDFGVAHMADPESTRLTQSGALLGTPAYMAPEQLLGGSIDVRADIYAFGVLLTEMLTGRHPLADGDRPVPARFASIVGRCVNQSAALRYASGRELREALTLDAQPEATEAGAAAAGIGSPRWWWEFHQALTAAVYCLMLWPAWLGRQMAGGALGRALFIATLIAVIVATILRLHLWFTSRFYPAELRWARKRTGRWIRAADWLFAGAIALLGLLVGEDRSPIAILLLAVAIGAALAFLVIERVTARAAFRSR